MGIPVVIAHFGGSPQYLRIGLESAARHNREVMLIGDESNAKTWDNHWNGDRAPMSRFQEFMKSYVKMSDYPDDYELAFWKRPFLVEAWMKSEAIREIFLTDSDVLSFADYSREVAPLLPRDCQATLMATQKQGLAELGDSLHFSYWKREALEDFIDFSIHAYKDGNMMKKLKAKHQWHLDHQQRGGVCEMTLLHYWAEQNSARVLNLAKATDGGVADLGISGATNYFDDEYGMRGGFKRLIFRNGACFGINKPLGREIRFWCIHCQGGAKDLMPVLHRSGLRAFFPQVHRVGRLAGAVERRSKSLVRRALRSLTRAN